MTLFDRRTAQVLATILLFAASLWLLWGLRELFFLLIVALFFAYTVEPLISAIYRHTPSFVSRRSAIFATFLIVFLSTAITGTIVGQLVVTQASQLIQQLPSLNEDPSRALQVPLPNQLEPFREEIMRVGSELARDLANGFLANISSAGFLLLAPVFGLFFLLEGPSWRNGVVNFAARYDRQVWLTALLDDLGNLLSNYIRALFLQSLSVFLGYLAFYQLAEVPYALLLATLAAALEVIPLLGWLSAALLSILVAIFTSYAHVGWLLVFYVAFRIFQDYVVTPLVMRKGVEVPPVMVLLGIIAGELLGGVRGIFLSIPVLATCRILYRHFLRRGTLGLLLAAASLHAHSISVSTSEATLDGSQLKLQLRMPRYEVEHIPANGLVSAFSFSGASLSSSNCQPQDQETVCQLAFVFGATPGEQIEARVTLARVTVPNHVHILRITRGPVTRQIVFDRTFEQERIDFHQPGRIEAFWRAARMGFLQLLYQPVLLALLLILPRSWPYAAAAAASFLVVLPDKFYASPGFFELATAISLTYLATEHLFFREASAKWLIVAVIGALEGASLAVLARPTGAGAVPFGTGNLIASLSVSLLARRFSRNIPEHLERYLYWAFAALGVLWTIWVFFNRF